MSGWIQTLLGDLTELVTKGTTPSEKDGGFSISGINYIKSDAISYEGKIDKTKFVCISQDIHEKFKRSQLKKDDILFSMAGAFLGKTGMVADDMLPANTNQAVAIIRVDKKKAEPKFIHFFLRQNSIVDFVNNMSGQSAQPNINFQEIRSISLDLPSLEEQKSIASVLSSLDDKIDLLHRQNKTLEAMAETLFRQWFVEGAGEWEEGTIDDVVSIKGGTTPSTKDPEFWDGNIHWTSPRDLSNHESVFMFDTGRKITEKGLAQIGSGLMPVGTVLMSSRAPIGYLAITDIHVSINQGYIAIVCDRLVSNYFMYLWCKANMDEIKNSGNGSVFEEISKSSFKALLVIIPPVDVLDGFNVAVKPVFEKIRANQLQAQNLEKLRDGLLPKLMSGEVRTTNLDLELI